jgi:uncharacterized protein YqgC (DUF456 family)
MAMIDVVVALLLVAGLVGAVVPVLPGTPLIFAGALLHAYTTDFHTLGVGRLAILAGLALVASVLEHVAGALGARRFGGGRGAIVGAIIGVVVGLTWPPFGLIICPIAGAIIGELIRTRAIGPSVRTGMGTALGIIAGVVMHLALAVMMVVLFVWWAWI